MSVEAFHAGNDGRSCGDSCGAGWVECDQADDVQKVPHIEWRGIASRSTRRHDVARTGCVISQYFKRLLANKNAASTFDLRNPIPWVADHQVEVFWSIAV